MSIRRVNPYILLNGTAGKAIELYQTALGAKTEAMMHWGDGPGACTEVPAEHKNRVMHAMLRVGDDVLMLSDCPPDQPLTAGDTVQIALDFTDADEMSKAFDTLGAGGKVTCPIADQFWGAKFGTLTDAYGVRWMFNCEVKK